MYYVSVFGKIFPDSAAGGKRRTFFLASSRRLSQLHKRKIGDVWEWSAGRKTGIPFFSQMIRDCLEGTETAMTQVHIFKAAELCVRAQMAARKLA